MKINLENLMKIIFYDEIYIPSTDAGDTPFEIEKDDDLEQNLSCKYIWTCYVEFCWLIIDKVKKYVKTIKYSQIYFIKDCSYLNW